MAIMCISILTIFQIKNIFTTKEAINIKIKVLPIILALILGVISVNKQQTFKHIELNNELRENKSNTIDKKYLYEHELDSELNETNLKLNNDTNKKHEKDIEKTIIVNENNPMILEDIRINPEKYIGKEIEVHGFVCKEDYLKENQFIIGRLIMTCCAADSKVVGIIGEYNNVGNLKENDKVNVIGIIRVSTIKDDNNLSHNIPVILIKKLKNEN